MSSTLRSGKIDRESTLPGPAEEVGKPTLQSLSGWTNAMLRQELKKRQRVVDSIKLLPKRKDEMIALLLKSYGDEVAKEAIVAHFEKTKKRSRSKRMMNEFKAAFADVATEVNNNGPSTMRWARELGRMMLQGGEEYFARKCYELHPDCPPIKKHVNPLWLEPLKLLDGDPTQLDFRASASLSTQNAPTSQLIASPPTPPNSELAQLDLPKKKLDIDFDLQKIPKVCSALEAVKQFTSDEMRRIVDKYKGQKDMWNRYFKRRYSDRKILHDEWKRLGSDDEKFLEVYGMNKDGTMVSMFMDQAFRKLLSLKTQLLEDEKRKDIYKRDGEFSQEEFSKMWRYGHINSLGFVVKPSAKRKVGDLMTDILIRNALWRAQYGSNLEDDD